ncbi:MAG: excinuclease ABC subunit C [Limisphaerales bacterium]|nr:MAG: excinuclease ABC subunit C [Limisphaerales bacterium]TXT45705.1 MAG: excinuclease ABC subunit C [Limisphaerales bacterium]
MSLQLRLLPAPKPLTERHGAAFFRGIPRAPGVYRMFDEAGLLLYVGQSSDLRDRLNSYRHVHPDRDSRKTIRLVHLVRRIDREVCDSTVSAVLRENELLRTLRPRFNRMNVYPKACFFIGVERDGGLLRLALTRDTRLSGKLFGAFKGAAWPFASLCRLLFIASHRDVELGQFPSRLLTTAPLRTQGFGLEESVAVLVEDYLAGESVSLVEALTDVCSQVEMRTPFEQNLMLADLITAEEFFERGPKKVKRLKQQANLGSNWVEPETLVDFLAVDRLEIVAMNDRIAP